MSKLMELFKESHLPFVFIAITYFTSGLLINFVQIILYLFLKPFNKDLYRKLNYYLCYSVHVHLVCIFDWWAKGKLYVYIDDEVLKKYVGREHFLLLSNHSYEIDWLMGTVYVDKINMLGNWKVIAKKANQYIPVLGWLGVLSECVFLERSYERDRALIQRQMNEIFDYHDPVCVLLNPEGTRFTQKKHEASLKFAREHGIPELKHHLIPRTKGFTAGLSILKEKCPAVYDVQIAFKKNDPVEPTLSNVFYGNSITAHMLVRRFPISSIPDDEDEAAEWIQNLFREKDKIQDSFHTHGDFFTSSGVPKVTCHLQKPRLCALLNSGGWAFFILTSLFCYLATFLFTGHLVSFAIGIGIMIGFCILLQKSIGMSKINKASSYGAVK